jgi:hypothetical protein
MLEFKDVYLFDTYNISHMARAARSLLKVCFLMSLDRRVLMEVMLEIRPKRPRQENRIPSHQYSYCFHT